MRILLRSGYWMMHYGLLALYVLAALFPLFWLLKVSVTPNNLLYSEGVRLWPSQTSWEHYASVLQHTDFPRFFQNSAIVSVVTAVAVMLILR